MKLKCMIGVAVLLACASGASAEKLSKDFRLAFEGQFPPQRSFAVVVEKGIPTTSIYGVQGNQSAAHYSIDVIGGNWKTSGGLLDTDQQAVDFLNVGEIMQLDSISFKDNRVDLRMVSTEAHQVTRGDWLSSRRPEPVATYFKFFLPFSRQFWRCQFIVYQVNELLALFRRIQATVLSFHDL